MRGLAIDFGFKCIGLAVGDIGFGIGSPRPSIKASGTLKVDAKNLASIARQEEADLLIVGLPIEETGIEGKMAKICRTLGAHLADLGCRVEYADERYTSLEAESGLYSAGISAKKTKERVHGESALLILERFSVEHKED